MKRINTVLRCGLLLAAAPALFAAEGPGDTLGVSTGTAAEPQPGLAAGYRGAALPIKGHQLLYVKPGDRIDLLVTFEAIIKSADKKEIKEKVTATILQNIVVLNVRKPEKPDELGAIELLLNPNEAQYAALSVAKGTSVSISIRAPADTELHPMEMASFRRLIK